MRLILETLQYFFNSLWSSDTTWRYRSWSNLAQLMAWCSQATWHHLNQCWIFISEVLWYSPEGNFIMSAQASIFCTVSLKIILLKCLLHLIGPNELKFTKKAKFLQFSCNPGPGAWTLYWGLQVFGIADPNFPWGKHDCSRNFTITVFAKLHRHISFCRCKLLNGRCWGKILCIKMYWTPAKMQLFADVGEYSFANAAIISWIILRK